GGFRINREGLVAALDLSLNAEFGKSVGLKFSVGATFQINTTGKDQTLVGLTLQPGMLIGIHGSVEFLGFARGDGNIRIFIGADGIRIRFDVSFYLGGLSFEAHGLAAVYSSGLVLDVAVSVNASVAVFEIDAAGRLQINTTGATRDGVPAGFFLGLNGHV